MREKGQANTNILDGPDGPVGFDDLLAFGHVVGRMSRFDLIMEARRVQNEMAILRMRGCV